MRCAQVLCLALVSAVAATAYAENGTVELHIPSGPMEVGESATIQLICRNTGEPGTPEVTVPDGLDLQLLNPTPAYSSMTRIINGRRTDETTYRFSMRLTALKEGTHRLGPVSVRADGKVYAVEPKSIVVKRTEFGSGPPGDRLIFADLQVEPRSLYVTQTITATLTFSMRKVEIDGRRYELDLLRNVLDLGSSRLSVFANGRAERSERWLPDSTGVRRPYEVFRVVEQIRADEVGELTIGPVFLKANYPTRIRRGFFGSLEVSQSREEFARADAVTVTVKPPPAEGRPASYNGAIGRFTMQVDAKPDRVEQGQPITLAIAIRGTPLDGVAGPDLTVHPELVSRFEFTTDELVGDLEGGAKVFRRAIFPKQSGEQTIPSLTWSYFDPERERYVTLASDPIDITVDPRTGGSTMVTLPGSQPRDSTETRLTLLTGGISPNFVIADAVLVDQSFRLTTPWLAAVIGSPLAWLAITLVASHRRRVQVDVGYARRRRAGRNARQRIRAALNGTEPSQQANALAAALTHYVSDRFGLGAGTLTADDVQAVLGARGVDPALVSETVEFLRKCDTVRYAPGTAGSLSPGAAAEQARRTLSRLERCAR